MNPQPTHPQKLQPFSYRDALFRKSTKPLLKPQLPITAPPGLGPPSPQNKPQNHNSQFTITPVSRPKLPEQPKPFNQSIPVIHHIKSIPVDPNLQFHSSPKIPPGLGLTPSGSIDESSSQESEPTTSQPLKGSVANFFKRSTTGNSPQPNNPILEKLFKVIPESDQTPTLDKTETPDQTTTAENKATPQPIYHFSKEVSKPFGKMSEEEDYRSKHSQQYPSRYQKYDHSKKYHKNEYHNHKNDYHNHKNEYHNYKNDYHKNDYHNKHERGKYDKKYPNHHNPNNPNHFLNRKPLMSKLPKSIYPELDRELNQVRALMSFKNNLVEHVIRYFKSNKIYNGGKLKYIRTQIYNHFPNWFFNANLKGDIVDFLPTRPLDIQENLDYIFKDHQVTKTSDFDQKLLTFNRKYIKDELQVREIQIVQKTEDEYIHYHLNNNGPVWKLLPLTNDQYLNLKRRYQGPHNKFHEHLSILMLRYKFLGGINNHLSIPPEVYQKLNIDHELFGSPFNVSTKTFCSPFPDYEKYWGSQGSFLNYPLQSNTTYAANPPFDVQVIQQLSAKLERELPHLSKTTIIITIPLWKVDFPAHNQLKNSKFLKDQVELSRERYPFFHYFKKSLIPASDTFLIIMSTDPHLPFNCNDIQSIWPDLPDKSILKPINHPTNTLTNNPDNNDHYNDHPLSEDENSDDNPIF